MPSQRGMIEIVVATVAKESIERLGSALNLLGVPTPAQVAGPGDAPKDEQ